MRLKIIAIVFVITLIVLGLVYLAYRNYQETEQLMQNVTQQQENKQEETNQNGEAKMIGRCIVKPFVPTRIKVESNYDYTQDMEYQDKIYHKKITSFEEYKIYKDRWNDILNMSEEDFDDKFMIITAVENTSMIGLTIKDIYINNNTLYITLEKYEEGVDFNIDEACHSMILPKYMETENIITQKKEIEGENQNQKYTFSNDSIIGLKRISKEEAEQIWLSMASMMKVPYNPINYKNYTQIIEIVAEERKPNSLFMQEDYKIEFASFDRKVWVVKTKDPNTISDFLDVYIDMYTKELVGGAIYGD